MKNKLKRKFYLNDANTVAKKLLGKYFVFNNPQIGIKLVGKIVETEAYASKIDEASHSFRGITPRNKVMFDEGGKLYVYFIYGVHYCLNIVTGAANDGSAVLIRAMEPIRGIKYFSKNRFGIESPNKQQYINLLNGPGKICQAFGINKIQNGIDLLGNEIYLQEGPIEKDPKIITTKRIGIKKSSDLPWRYYIDGNAFISKK